MSSFVYLSKASKITNAPLVVMLHGYSSNEADLFSFASLIPDDYHVVSLQAPLFLGIGYAWFPIHFEENMERWTSPEEAKQAVDYVTAFLAYYTKKNDVDVNNITLLGFSQGAMLSYSVGLVHPNVSAIAALSGYLDPRVVSFNNLNKKIYVSHGEQDMVVPYSSPRSFSIWVTINKVNALLTPYLHGCPSPTREFPHFFLQGGIVLFGNLV